MMRIYTEKYVKMHKLVQVCNDGTSYPQQTNNDDVAEVA